MKKYLKEFKRGEKIEVLLMVNKILNKDSNIVAYLGDKSGEIKATFKSVDSDIHVGDILLTKGTLGDNYKIDEIKKSK